MHSATARWTKHGAGRSAGDERQRALVRRARVVRVRRLGVHAGAFAHRAVQESQNLRGFEATLWPCLDCHMDTRAPRQFLRTVRDT
jgi:hypothetical protein